MILVTFYWQKIRSKPDYGLACLLVAYFMLGLVVNQSYERLDDREKIIAAQKEQIEHLKSAKDSSFLQESRREQTVRKLAEKYLTSSLNNSKQEN